MGKKRDIKCGKKCYYAKGSKCTCICGGKNHGQGLIKSFFNILNKIEERKEKEDYGIKKI